MQYSMEDKEKDIACQPIVDTTKFGITKYSVPKEIASALREKGWFCCHIDEPISCWQHRAEQTIKDYEEMNLSEFEKRLRFHMHECIEGRHDPNDLKDVKDTAAELRSLIDIGIEE